MPVIRWPDSDLPLGSLYNLPEEFYWQNPVPPVALTFSPVYLPDLSDVPAGSLFGQPEEYYWQNQVAPDPGSLLPLYLPDPTDLPTLTGTPEEYYWQNPVAPQPLTLGPLFLPDPEMIPAGNLYNLPDEIYWQNPVSPQPLVLSPIYWYDQAEVVFVSTFQPDEDFWRNQVPPIPLQFGAIYLPDPEMIPAGSLYNLPDEVYWQNRINPVPMTFLGPIWNDAVEIAYPSAPSDDFWVNPGRFDPGTFTPLYPFGGTEDFPGNNPFIILVGGNFQYATGVPIANGYLEMRLASDCRLVAIPYGQIMPMIPFTLALDPTGNIQGAPKVYSNHYLASLSPGYWVTIYDSNGARVNTGGILWIFNQPGGSTVTVTNYPNSYNP